MIALLAVCAVATLSQGAPPLQTFDRTLITTQQDNWTHSFFFSEREMTVSKEHFDAGGGYVTWQPRANRTTRTHTRTNAVETGIVDRTFTYYFDPTQDIEIFDRTPNTPVWYGIAVGVTAIAMITFYLIVRKKRKSGSTHPTNEVHPNG
jgi:hypothetical protein